MGHIIKTYIKIGETIIDPFCGSGPIPFACEEMKRHWIAIDQEDDAIELTINRFKKNKQMKLF